MFWFRAVVPQVLILLPLVYAQCYYPNGRTAPEDTPWYVFSLTEVSYTVRHSVYCFPKIYQSSYNLSCLRC